MFADLSDLNSVVAAGARYVIDTFEDAQSFGGNEAAFEESGMVAAYFQSIQSVELQERMVCEMRIQNRNSGAPPDQAIQS
jgi:hypothetical protein